MKPKKGWFSIIQFCPDLNRLEAANIGVLLFCPETQFLDAKISKNNKRIRKFFGPLHDEKRSLDLFKQGLEDRLEYERDRIVEHSQLLEFIDRRANQIRISAPRSIRLIDPVKQLNELYEKLVEGTRVADVAVFTAERVEQQLTRSLEKPSIQQKLYRSIPVKIPVDGCEMDVPYGYQNGRFNLIQPVQFPARDPLPKAYQYAVHGDSIYENEHEEHGEQKLVVVGSFNRDADEKRLAVKRVLCEHHVSLFDISELDELVKEIEATGKDRQQSSRQ